MLLMCIKKGFFEKLNIQYKFARIFEYKIHITMYEIHIIMYEIPAYYYVGRQVAHNHNDFFNLLVV